MMQQLHLRYAIGHQQAGRLEAAERAYRGVLADDPDCVDALRLLAELRLHLGDAAEAEALALYAIQCAPALAETHSTLAAIRHQSGDLVGAEASYRRAGEIAPTPNTLNNLGTVLLASGDEAAASDVLRQACALDPSLVAAYANLGTALVQLARFDDALTAFDSALALEPDNGAVIASRAAALGASGDIEGSIAGYRMARERAPADASVPYGLGVLLMRVGRSPEAIAAFRDALAIDPNHIDTVAKLAQCLIRAGSYDAGIAMTERLLALDPDNARAYYRLLASYASYCDWDSLDARLPELAQRVDATARGPVQQRALLLPLTFTLPYFSTDIALQKQILQAVSDSVVDSIDSSTPIAPAAASRERLRIGYLSPNFGDHPIAHVTVPVFEQHDREHFEIFAYTMVDLGDSSDEHYQRIKAAADALVDVSGASPNEIAARIAADGIDILVDLCGYMANGKPAVLALRPAPVQAYWLGHGGGLGAPFIDYVIGDPFVTPPRDDHHYVESIARLPETFSSADRPPIAPLNTNQTDEGLPETGVVFCAFNNTLKIDRLVFSRWMAILRAVPDSVLWLSKSATRHVTDRLRAAAAAEGVADSRVVFAKRLPNKADHLARHALADLFLDTLTFNASTTALDALWAGLPVLTVAGAHFHSRIATGYVTALDMPELVCTSADDYEARAVSLANDRESLATLRAKLADARMNAPLFDGARFTRHLEAAYVEMWRQACAGGAFSSFSINPLPR